MSLASHAYKRLCELYGQVLKRTRERNARLFQPDRVTVGPVTFESLEPRLLLSGDLPGMNLVDPIADRFDGQVIQLDFDGQEDAMFVGVGESPWQPGGVIWLDFDPNDGLDGGAPAKIELTSSSEIGIAGQISIGGVWLESVTLGGTEFIRLTVPGYGYTSVIGEPQLPVIRNLLVVPEGAEVTVEISGQPELLSMADLGMCQQLAPAQAPVAKLPGELDAAPLDFSEAIYQADEFAPGASVWLTEGGYIAGQRLMTFEVAPISYNPIAEQISVFDTLTFHVDFKGGQWETSELSGQEDVHVADLTLNYVPNDAKGAAKAPGRLLIVAHDDFAGNLAAYIAHKESLGWTVDLADTTTAGTTNTQIRSYIQSQYNNIPTRPDAVLLVGDTDRIPHFVGSGVSVADTDLYYACMDAGDDWYPEFPLGRFSVADATDLANVIDKTIWYETSSTGAWRAKAAFMAGVDHYWITERTHDWVIANYMDPLGYTSDTLYEVTYGATTRDVSNAFNDGRAFGIYSGHGGEYSWADGPSFSQSDVMNLTNTGMYPLVGSFACITGTYTVDESFMETWLRTPNSGAVVAVGSSASTYWDEDEVLEQRLFSAIYDEGYVAFGGAWMRAKELFLQHYGAGYYMVRDYFEMYNVMGDPTVEVLGLEFGIDTPADLPLAYVGEQYDFTLSAQNGTEPYTWAVTVGALPAGLSLGPNTGIISGTPTGVTDETFTIQVTDAALATTDRQFNLSVLDRMTITTASILPVATIGENYSVVLQAAGGTTPYTWASPLLEYAETDPGGGYIGGGTAQGWHADDGSWNLNLPWSFTYYGNTYNSVYVCSNGFIDFALGTTDYSNSQAELLSNVRIAPLWDDLRTDSPGEDIFVTQNADYVAIRWDGRTFSGGNPVDVEVVLYRDGNIQFNYGQAHSGLSPTIGVSAGDNTRYTMSVRDGSGSIPSGVSSLLFWPALPGGLSLNGATGEISGTPTEIGDFAFLIEVQDAGTLVQTATRAFDLEVIVVPGEIHGSKWHDLNANGIWDGGEPGLGGWTIFLDADNDGELDGGEVSTVTAGNGSYSFTDVIPGDYNKVCEVLQAGWLGAFPLLAPTGGLSFLQVVRDGVGGVGGLDGASAVTVSPDGSHVYAVGYSDDALGVFSRDGATGELSFVEVLRDGVGGVDGLDGAFSVTVSPDGQHVYAAGRDGNALAVFDRDAATGELSFVEVIRDDVDGVDGLNSPYSVTVSPDGSHVYAAGWGDNALAVFSRDGATGELSFVEVVRDGVGGADGLYGAFSVTVSADGDHVYAAGYLENALAVFDRDGATGELSFVEVVRDDVGGVDGLNGVHSVTVSPDGLHVYAAGSNDDALGVFDRDGATGQLTFVQVIRDGVAGVDGLSRPHSVTVSPDGSHVYASGYWDDALAVFNRNVATGRLSLVEMVQDGAGGVDGLSSPSSVTVSPDGSHVYAAGLLDDALAVFSRDFDHFYYLTLLSAEVVVGQDFGNYEAASISGQEFEDLDGNGIWDGGEPGLEGWTVYLDDNDNGQLDDGETSTTSAPDGSYAFTDLVHGDYEVRRVLQDGWLQTYPTPPTYSLTLVIGDADKTGIDFGNALGGSISGRKFEDLNGNGVRNPGEPYLDGWTVELVDPGGGVLETQVTASIDVDENGTIDPETEVGLYGFEDLLPGNYEVQEVLQSGWIRTLPAASPYVIALGYGQDSVDVDFGNWAIPSEIHGQKWHDVNADGVKDAGEPGLDGWTIELVDTTTGLVLDTQVTSGGGLYSFTGLARGDYEVREIVQAGWQRAFPLAEGELSFVQVIWNLDGATAVTVSPDGSHVYAAGYSVDALVVFDRDGATGVLSFVEMVRDGVGGVDGLDGAFSVTVSPDGQHVYAVGQEDNALAVFSRAAGGQLTFVEVVRDGVGGVDGLDRPYSVTVSPDGSHVYAAGWDDNALAVFGRDAGTGELSFVEVVRDRVGGVDGLCGATSVTVSPDGHHVYAAGYYDNALALFDRDAATGGLSFVEVVRDGIGGVDGLNGPYSVTVSPDGHHVYAAGSNDNALAVFSRDATTGQLSFVEFIRDGVAGVDGLYGAHSVTVSPDGGHVYATGYRGDELAVFSRATTTGYHTVALPPGVLAQGADFGNIPTPQILAVDERGRAEFVDADGDLVTVQLTGGGMGTLWFANQGNCDIAKIVLNDTTVKSRLTITVRKLAGAGETTIGDATVNGDLKDFVGSKVDLEGSIYITGALVGKLQLDDVADDHRIDIGVCADPKAAATLVFDCVADLVVNALMPIKKFTATEWLDLGGIKDALITTWLGDLKITGSRTAGRRGDFEADVTATGANDKGVAVKKIDVAGLINNVAITALSGHVGDIKSAQWNGGSLDTVWAKKIETKGLKTDPAVPGNINNVDVTLTGDDGKTKPYSLHDAKIAGNIVGGVWDFAGNVKNIKALSTAADWTLTAAGFVTKIDAKNALGGAISALWFKDIKTKGNLTAAIAAAGKDDKNISIHKLEAGRVGNLSLGVPGGLKKVKVWEWLGGTITAAWIDKFQTTGNKNASVVGDTGVSFNISGADAPKGMALKDAKIAGQITGGMWNINGAGNVNSIKALNSDATWVLNALGGVKKIDFKNGLGGTLTAKWFGDIKAKGDAAAGTTITATGQDDKGISVKKFDVAHAGDTTLNAQGGVKDIKVWDWIGGLVNADWIGKLQSNGNKTMGVAGHFGAAVTLTGLASPKGMTLNTGKIVGNLDGKIDVQKGNAGNITIGGELNADILIAGDAKHIKVLNDVLSLTLPAVLGPVVQVGGTAKVTSLAWSGVLTNDEAYKV